MAVRRSYPRPPATWLAGDGTNPVDWRMYLGFALLALLASSCSTTRPLLVSGDRAALPDTLPARRQSIRAFVMQGGERRAFDGYVVADGDSLRFIRPAHPSRGLERDEPGETRVVPRDSVVAVEAVETNVPASIALVSVIAAGLYFSAATVAFALSIRDESWL
jgi:hypothetical protein